jgi:hypothetical protein
VAVGGTEVDVGTVDGTGVGATAGLLHPTKSHRIDVMPAIRCNDFWILISFALTVEECAPPTPVAVTLDVSTIIQHCPTDDSGLRQRATPVISVLLLLAMKKRGQCFGTVTSIPKNHARSKHGGRR